MLVHKMIAVLVDVSCSVIVIWSVHVETNWSVEVRRKPTVSALCVVYSRTYLPSLLSASSCYFGRHDVHVIAPLGEYGIRLAACSPELAAAWPHGNNLFLVILLLLLASKS